MRRVLGMITDPPEWLELIKLRHTPTPTEFDVSVDEHIAKIVAAAPPIQPDVAARLRILLSGGDDA